MTVCDPAWEQVIGAIRATRRPCSVYVLGGSDRGKTTLARYLLDQLRDDGPVARIDCDPGQATIGPPTTIGVQVYDAGAADPRTSALRFVGAASPAGHLLELLAGCAALERRARDLGVSTTILDSSGFVLGPVASEFQYQAIDLLRPAHLVAIQRGRELEPLLANFRRAEGIAIHRLKSSEAVVRRGQEQRQRYRRDRWSEYFSAALEQEIPLAGLGFHGHVPPRGDLTAWHGMLAAVCDTGGFVLSLGVIADVDPCWTAMRLVAPPFDIGQAASIQVGTLRRESPDLASALPR
jgi:polynucleotide 5'-hydroxyl-kinase GRC3/NOL9